MNNALRRGTWDKSSTGIMYVTIEYPNLLSNPLLTQPGEVVWMYSTKKFELPHGDLNSNSHHSNSVRYHWATTPLVIHPSNIIYNLKVIAYIAKFKLNDSIFVWTSTNTICNTNLFVLCNKCKGVPSISQNLISVGRHNSE